MNIDGRFSCLPDVLSLKKSCQINILPNQPELPLKLVNYIGKYEIDLYHVKACLSMTRNHYVSSMFRVMAAINVPSLDLSTEPCSVLVIKDIEKSNKVNNQGLNSNVLLNREADRTLLHSPLDCYVLVFQVSVFANVFIACPLYILNKLMIQELL